MKKRIIAALPLVSSLALFAAPVTLEQAETAAESWVNGKTYALTTDFSGKQIVEKWSHANEAGEVLFHCVNFAGGGYVVTSPDDDLFPVITYSGTGSFNKDDVKSPLWKMLVGDMRAQVGSLAGKRRPLMKSNIKVAAGNSNQNLWGKLLHTSGSPLMKSSRRVAVPDVRVAPLLRSKWDQADAHGDLLWNYYTPSNYVCGCVATAMAQVMRYHEFPVNAVTPVSTKCTVNEEFGNKEKICFTMMGGVYAWNDMPLDLSENGQKPATRERQAVGKLIYDCGVSVMMNWARIEEDEYGQEFGGSGTAGTFTSPALKQIFGYASARNYLERGGVDEDGDFILNPIDVKVLQNILCSNLDAKSPCLLGIASEDGGHEIVADGYGYAASTLFFHLNMGWSGSEDIWYALPMVDTGMGTFTEVQEITYNIFPEKAGEIVSGRITNQDGEAVIAEVSLKVGDYEYATTMSSDTGIYSFIVDPDMTYEVSACCNGATSTVQTVAVNSSQDYEFEMKDGNWGDGKIAGVVECGNRCGVNLVMQSNQSAKPREPLPSLDKPCLDKAEFTFVTYVGGGVSVTYDVNNLNGGMVTMKKIGKGKLPAGVRLKYDKKTKKVILSGAPSRAGTYEYEMRLDEKSGLAKTEGVVTRFKFEIWDPKKLLPGDINYNPAFGKKIATELPILNEEDRFAGMLSVSVTVKGAITAKIKRQTGKIIMFRGNWQGINKGEWQADLTAKTGEKLKLFLMKNGNLFADLGNFADFPGEKFSSTPWGVAAAGDYAPYAGKYEYGIEDGEKTVVLTVSKLGKVSYKCKEDRTISGTTRLLLNSTSDGSPQVYLFKQTRTTSYFYNIPLSSDSDDDAQE